MRDISMERVNKTREAILETIKNPTMTHEQKVCATSGLADSLLEVLNKVPIKKGNTFFITSGTVHAICKGALIAEIQQNSDITYRVYDYGRVGKDGKQRELHIDKAIDVSVLNEPKEYLSKVVEENESFKKILLSKCEFFETYKIELKKEIKLRANSLSFNFILCLEGEALISSNTDTLKISKGDSIFIPANFGEYTIKGECEFIFTVIP